MSLNRASSRAFAVFALLIALTVASLPAQTRQPVQRLHAVAASGDGAFAGIWRFIAGLLPQGTSKEGMSIDPNGAPVHQGVAAPSVGAVTDEGPTIDPNGRQ